MDQAERSLRTASLIFELSTDSAAKDRMRLERDFESHLWVIVTSYYSMFYVALALLASQGIRAGRQLVALEAARCSFDVPDLAQSGGMVTSSDNLQEWNWIGFVRTREAKSCQDRMMSHIARSSIGLSHGFAQLDEEFKTRPGSWQRSEPLAHSVANEPRQVSQ